MSGVFVWVYYLWLFGIIIRASTFSRPVKPINARSLSVVRQGKPELPAG
jgi:hypothetical protein